jgi:hypothetical protein
MVFGFVCSLVRVFVADARDAERVLSWVHFLALVLVLSV